MVLAFSLLQGGDILASKKSQRHITAEAQFVTLHATPLRQSTTRSSETI
jgi:hypothetical protein